MTFRIAVVVTNYAAAANIGGGLETSVRTFDLPPDALAYITEQKRPEFAKWQTLTLALHEEEPKA